MGALAHAAGEVPHGETQEVLSSSRLTQILDVPQRWGAKQPAVFTTELRGALITNLKSSRKSIHVLCEHQPSGLI